MRRSLRHLIAAAAFAAILPVLAAGSSPALAGQAGESLDEILKKVAAYDGGIHSEAIWKLNDIVRASKDLESSRAVCEGRLLDFLAAGKATPSAKSVVARHLRMIAGPKAIPVLQTLLLDPGTIDAALYALDGIDGPAADEAFLQALSRAPRAIKPALIAVLGDRKAAAAVGPLAKLASDRTGEFPAQAATALGSIGSAEAANALLAAFSGARADVRPAFASALLRCAEGLKATGGDRAAAPLYDKILAEASLPATIRDGAMIGKLAVSGDKAPALLLEGLKGSDPAIHAAAVASLRKIIKPESIDAVCALLPERSEPVQVQILAALAGYPKAKVLPTVLRAARGKSAPVRLAAFKALETVGDASVAGFLAEAAAGARGAEQAAARTALESIKGRDADEAVLGLLGGASTPAVQAEALRAIGGRQLYAAKSAVAPFLSSGSPEPRIQAIRTLRVIGTPSDIPALLDALLKAEGEAEMGEAAAAAAALAAKIAGPDGRAAAVTARLAGAKSPADRARLLDLAGRIGDDSALPAVRAGLADADAGVVDAAIRSLAAWPTPAARHDALALAKSARDETHRLLALQGFIRMTAGEKYAPAEEAVASLRTAAGLAARPEEKKLVLAALTGFPCPAGLAFAESLGADAALQAEAKAAAVKIRERLAKK
jgi:HEAT repeat protein